MSTCNTSRPCRAATGSARRPLGLGRVPVVRRDGPHLQLRCPKPSGTPVPQFEGTKIKRRVWDPCEQCLTRNIRLLVEGVPWMPPIGVRLVSVFFHVPTENTTVPEQKHSCRSRFATVLWMQGDSVLVSSCVAHARRIKHAWGFTRNLTSFSMQSGPKQHARARGSGACV